MDKKEKFDWVGVDGQRYTYDVHSLPKDFKPGILGNYIFTKKSNDGNWVPIYIGQGDLGVQIGHYHPQSDCIKDMGATHVHIHPNDNEWVRISEEHDLLESNLKSFEPHGCNFKEEEEKKVKEEEEGLFKI